jgi:hypothetical protein
LFNVRATPQFFLKKYEIHGVYGFSQNVFIDCKDVVIKNSRFFWQFIKYVLLVKGTHEPGA